MEKLYFEIPSIARKEDAIDYIREFHEYQSDINGTGGLDRFIDNYEGWLEKLEQDYTRIPNEQSWDGAGWTAQGIIQSLKYSSCWMKHTETRDTEPNA